jgi:hypothetical protein
VPGAAGAEGEREDGLEDDDDVDDAVQTLQAEQAVLSLQAEHDVETAVAKPWPCPRIPRSHAGRDHDLLRRM